MGKILVANLKVGSKITEDVKIFSGRVVIKAGAVVHEKHLHLLKSWGVKVVSSSQDDTETIPVKPSPISNPDLTPIDRLFALANLDNEVMKHLKSTARALMNKRKGSSSQ